MSVPHVVNKPNMCSKSCSLYYKRDSNCVPPTSLQSLLHRRCRASHTWPNKFSCLVRLSIAPWTHAASPPLALQVCLILYHILHTTPQKVVEWCQIWWSCCPRNWSRTTNTSIWIWLKGCIPAVLGQQNESEQIVAPVRFQNSMVYSTQTVRFRTGVPSWTMIS